MAEVIGLDGVPVEHKSKASPVEACLEQLLSNIEDGLAVENVIVIAVITDPDNPACVRYEPRDSGMRVGETVFILEAVKHGLIHKTFEGL